MQPSSRVRARVRVDERVDDRRRSWSFGHTHLPWIAERCRAVCAAAVAAVATANDGVGGGDAAATAAAAALLPCAAFAPAAPLLAQCVLRTVVAFYVEQRAGDAILPPPLPPLFSLLPSPPLSSLFAADSVDDRSSSSAL
jgi:hypothetical protein